MDGSLARELLWVHSFVHALLLLFEEGGHGGQVSFQLAGVQTDCLQRTLNRALDSRRRVLREEHLKEKWETNHFYVAKPKNAWKRKVIEDFYSVNPVIRPRSASGRTFILQPADWSPKSAFSLHSHIHCTGPRSGVFFTFTIAFTIFSLLNFRNLYSVVRKFVHVKKFAIFQCKYSRNIRLMEFCWLFSLKNPYKIVKSIQKGRHVYNIHFPSGSSQGREHPSQLQKNTYSKPRISRIFAYLG